MCKKSTFVYCLITQYNMRITGAIASEAQVLRYGKHFTCEIKQNNARDSGFTL